MNNAGDSETCYLSYTLELVSPTVVHFRHPAQMQQVRLDAMDYFRVVSETGGWRLEICEESVRQPTLRVSTYEIGLELYTMWLECPRTRPLNLKNRPKKYAWFKLLSLEDEAVFVEVDGSRQQRFKLSELDEPVLHGTSVGSTWKWWLELDQGSGPCRFYVEDGPETYAKLFAAWAEHASR